MDFKDLQRKLGTLIREVGDAQTMVKVAKQTAETVKKRTRRGFGVEQTGGRSKRLKKLADGYKKTRRGLKKRGQLSTETTPAKSNLTKSGEMLDSIKGEGKTRQARIYIDGSRNEKKVKDQVEQGRVFMNLNRAEVKDIIDILEEDLNKDMKKKGL